MVFGTILGIWEWEQATVPPSHLSAEKTPELQHLGGEKSFRGGGWGGLPQSCTLPVVGLLLLPGPQP